MDELRIKLIELHRRLNQLKRMKPKNGIEGLGIQMQKWGIRLQIRGIMIKFKNK